MHRGAFVKNTENLHALVIHTGVDTKLIMNLGTYNMKQSYVEKNINKVIAFNILTLLVLSGISAGLCSVFVEENGDWDYLFYDNPGAGNLTFKAFWSFYLILNALVPLELVVGLEIAKLFYTYHMDNDAYMMEPDYELN